VFLFCVCCNAFLEKESPDEQHAMFIISILHLSLRSCHVQQELNHFHHQSPSVSEQGISHSPGSVLGRTWCCFGQGPLGGSQAGPHQQGPPHRSGQEDQRIIESLWLEKTSKIIKSNHPPNTTLPIKPYPEVPHLHVFRTPPGMVTQPPPWAACSNA